jgi:hypothetical protein
MRLRARGVRNLDMRNDDCALLAHWVARRRAYVYVYRDILANFTCTRARASAAGKRFAIREFECARHVFRVRAFACAASHVLRFNTLRTVDVCVYSLYTVQVRVRVKVQAQDTRGRRRKWRNVTQLRTTVRAPVRVGTCTVVHERVSGKDTQSKKEDQ